MTWLEAFELWDSWPWWLQVVTLTAAFALLWGSVDTVVQLLGKASSWLRSRE
jgi:hypothetical protein